MKKTLPILALLCVLFGIYFFIPNDSSAEVKTVNTESDVTVKKKKKTDTERMLYAEERAMHEFNMQKNPDTGEIPIEEKAEEFENSIDAIPDQTQRTTSSTYTFRGPSNFGGRTRGLVIDISDATSNTILAGGVSGGVFRSTDGGSTWTKVSANDEIHNVTAIAQDPRPGFQNIWYYATGERRGNSASLGSFYLGQGIWQSTDGGVTWAKIPGTDSELTSFNSPYDIINNLAVNPTNGDLLIASHDGIYRYDGTNLNQEIDEPDGLTGMTDVVYTSSGRAYAAIDGGSSVNGVYTSPTGNGSWTRISQNGSPIGWSTNGRIVLGTAPSNDDIVYGLYVVSGFIEAELWRYTQSTDTWDDFSATLPDEPGGNLAGNDPFAVQGGYDLVVSVKPDDENFVVIGGTNAYKVEDITASGTEFTRIGGYINNASYGLYNIGGVVHHPDIHALVFDPNNTDVLFSGTDGGVHKTLDININPTTWVNLNNDYRTYQYYHVAMDPQTGSDLVFGGAQDNGTTRGGTIVGNPDNSTMTTYFGGDGVAVGIARRPSNIQYYYGTQNGNIRTNLPTFRSIRPFNSSSQFVTYFYLDPDNNDALYYAGLSTLYMTTDSENVSTIGWTNMGSLPISQNLRTFATSPGTYDPANSYLLIGGQSGGVYRLDDPQNQTNLTGAVNITPSGASTADGSVVSGFGIHPTDPDKVIATYANYGINSIYYTENATDANPTWTLVERNLPTHSVRSAAIAEVGSETIFFVGTARGLYSTNDPLNNDWELEAQNDIGFAVVSGLVYRASDKKLLIGTHGNGMFDTTVEGTLSNSEFSIVNKFTVFPNPAISELNLQSANFNFSGALQYEISDITGKVINRGTIDNKRVDVRNLNSGIYFLGLNIEGSKQTIKFIKQ